MKLNFKEFGEGQALLILHGLMGSLDNWQTLAKRFSKDFKVYTIDQRNHGQSPHSDEMNYDVLADDLKKFIEDHAISNPILMGHSMGGKTVMKYTLENPDSVKALISADIAPKDYSIHHDHIMEALQAIDFEVVKSRRDVEEILMSYIHSKGVVQLLSKNVYWESKEKLGFRFNLDALYHNLDLISAWPHCIGSYEGKTLFIRGSKADYVNDDEPNIAAYFPNSTLVTLDASHWVHAEKPDDFYSSVIEFLL